MSKQTWRYAVRRTLPSMITIFVLVALATVLALIAAGGQDALAAQGIIYVDAEATGANSGSSWEDAFTGLQDALAAAGDGDEIWVAEGIYRPTTETDRMASFQLVNGVALYGGFEGTETNREERDWVTHETILSGDLNGDDDRPGGVHDDDNSYHVFYHPDGTGLDSNAILDGFIISGGNANGSDPNDAGGGMYNDGSSPALANCTFEGNSAASGAGMYNYDSSPTLVNCTFSSNSATNGGGMYNGYSGPALTDCTFSGNSAGAGGGMRNYWSWPALTNCIFSSNSASSGGGIFNTSSSSTLVNCTIWGNSGGGITNFGFSSPRLTNCILWGNTPNEIVVGPESSPAIAYCDIQGGYEGEGNIDEDPLFVDAEGGDLHLRLGSPAFDAGDNLALPPEVTTDLDGNPRISHGRVDMGAYEIPVSIYLPLLFREG